MDYKLFRTQMMEAAISAMTKQSTNRKKLLDDIGNGNLMTITDPAGNSVSMNADGSIEDDNIAEESDATIETVKVMPETIELYFAYSFGGSGLNFKQAPPEHTIKHWTSAFPKGDNKAWEKVVKEKLRKINPKYPYAWIDYDGDFGYQGVILTISSKPISHED